MPSHIHMFPTPEIVAQELSKRIAQQIQEIISQKNMCTLLLSGGSTPRLLYQKLSQADIQWNSVHIFLSDERFVPMDSPESNLRMIRENLLDHVHIPPENIHPIPTNFSTKEESAEQYEKEIQEFFGSSFDDIRRLVPTQSSALDSRFPSSLAGRRGNDRKGKGNDKVVWDVNILGVGEDCHTASLFPHSKSLHEEKKLVVGVDRAKPPKEGITMTFPILNSSRHIYFLATGEGKAESLQRILKGKESVDDCPAKGIVPIFGTIEWWVDEKATKNLALLIDNTDSFTHNKIN